ncbi:hypothetical protein [Pseudonocardia sp. WMMC193]|uniref:hypothetical protein n=1 Tax=Pseudonocardia sp. WMMC193 TaxID=2911965 RepID=UPI001F355BE6|nr:hypothetical protein [Pseudonocardia sp. WMMC193]MCF7548898.1 hypothetical protein [Pseudonocardia sp. WMMC193]
MAGGLTVKVNIDGVRDTLAAFRNLPKDASDELRDRSQELAETLAVKVRAAGNAMGRQDAVVARSVRARRDRVPVITAGGRGKAGLLVFGSEFGMNKRSGWYAARRFDGSEGRQFREHVGQSSWWFFRTVEENEAQIGREWTEAADTIVRKWAS